MTRKRFAGTLGAMTLVVGAAWTQFGVAHAVSFTPPPNSSAPREATGGASRGSLFVPPSDNLTPRQATGGASRGGLFVPPADSLAPRQATGGASRDGLFTPPSGSPAPRQAMGGASRGSFFTPPPENAAPQQAAGGASRTNAYGSYLNSGDLAQMMALMPESFYGTTVSTRPTILVYVPASSAQEAIFSLKDENKNLLYQMTVPVSGEGGVMSIQLPEDSPELAVGQHYQWYFALNLEGVLNTASPFVDGWIQRIDPSDELAQTLGQGSSLETITALGAQGVWYDTAAELAALHATQSDEVIAKHWEELLESVGLSEIATAAIN